MSECEICHDVKWVCEADHLKPWQGVSDHPEACTCEGCAGDPCDECNGHYDRDDPPANPPGFVDHSKIH